MMVALPRRKAAVLVLLTQLLFATTVHPEPTLDGITCTTDEKEICKAGDGDCQVGASRMVLYCEDHAVQQAAIAMLEGMCGQNHGRACTGLGIARQNRAAGHDVDEKAALAVFIKACNLDCEVGCFYAARLGLTRRNVERSVEYFRRSCELGSDLACEHVDSIERGDIYMPLLFGGLATATALFALFYIIGRRVQQRSKARCAKRVLAVVWVVGVWVYLSAVFFCGSTTFVFAARTAAVATTVGLVFFCLAGRTLRSATGEANENEEEK